MIRDFSLVFLLLISDRRNLHRDSRRDTEQNVPCMLLSSYSCTVDRTIQQPQLKNITTMLLYSSAAVAGLSCPQYFSLLLSSYSCCYILQLRLLDCPVHSIALCYYHLIHVVIFFSCGCWIVLSTVFLYVIIILFMLLYSSAVVAGLSCP